MQDTDQFARLLHIQQPWRVSLVEVDDDELTVTVHVRIDDGVDVHCPTCHAVVPRYDRRRRTWRHLDTMEFSTFVTAEIPRVECPEHGVRQLSVPWAEDSSRYTVAFECFVIDWLKEASVNAVALQCRLSWAAIAALMKRAVDRGLERRDLDPPVHLAVDETAFQKRHEYVTVVTDQQSGAVVHVADDRSIESLDTYFAELTPEECARIESVSMDMWPAYIRVVERYVPYARERICFDKFHIAKYLADAVDKVRRAEHRELRAEGFDWLTGTKHRWLQNPATMSRALWRSFDELRRSTLKTARAWSLKECAMMLWHYSSRTWARKQWKKWITAALRSRLEPLRRVAATFRRHLDGIINAVVLKKTNATAESVNSRIQRLKYRACGYRNRQRFRTAIMFHCGKLNLYPRPAAC